MHCTSCGSELVDKFGAEIFIHPNEIGRPPVCVFPRLVVCLACGCVAQFAVPKAAARLLANGPVAGKFSGRKRSARLTRGETDTGQKTT